MKRLEATHFIEHWDCEDYRSSPHPIDLLDYALRSSKDCGLITVAIFKIKFK